jgi:hypothetical protein
LLGSVLLLLIGCACQKALWILVLGSHFTVSLYISKVKAYLNSINRDPMEDSQRGLHRR